MKVTGVKELQRLFSRLTEKNLRSRLEKILEDVGKLTLSRLKQNTPVDKGVLKSSEDVFKQGALSILVGPDLRKAPYAGFVEEGHFTRSGSFVQYQFYIQKTALEISPFITRLFKIEIVKFIKKR